MALPNTPSTRIKANNVFFALNKATTVFSDQSWDCTMISIKSEDASNDQTTFYDASIGGAVDKYFEIEIIQSMDAGSFWQYLYSNPGKELKFQYSPTGVLALSATNPGFTGMVRLPRLLAAGLGGAAAVDGTYGSETVRLDIVDDPNNLLAQLTTGTWTRVV